MRFPRIRLLISFAVGFSGPGAPFAQETPEPASSAAAPSGTGGRSAAELLNTPFTGGAPGASSTTPPGTNPATPTFRTGAASTLPETTPGAAPTPGASAFGAGQAGAAQDRVEPTTFSVPGLYGRGPLEFTAGQGRLARPRFRVTAGLSVGYDDNVFQTPTHPASVPDQEVEVLVSPEIPATTRTVVVSANNANVPDFVATEVVPGQPAEFRTVVIPGVPAPERIGSFITRAEAELNVQFATRRDLLTLDLEGSASYYFDRPGDQKEYTGSLALIYLRKLSGRAQFSAIIRAAYLAQPDFSQPNNPTSNSGGSYISANAKADISYRLTPRFSTVTSVAYNAIHFVEEGETAGNFGETTFGTELRYLFSPRLTLLGEVRYSSSLHEQEERDFTSYRFLLGSELKLSRRFTATLRAGAAVQTFETGGEKSTSPYVEGTLAYLLARGTAIQFNARYGFEESGSADSRTIVGRVGLTLARTFTPRFQGSLALNYVNNVTEFDVADQPGQTGRGTTELVQDTIDATLAFHYILSRQWSFNLSYTYTLAMGPVDTSDYYRQRTFLGAQYLF